jgi:hypothetical protein
MVAHPGEPAAFALQFGEDAVIALFLQLIELGLKQLVKVHRASSLVSYRLGALDGSGSIQRHSFRPEAGAP